ncbi:MAG: hypothetical protein M1813_006806 [Trichoglossum hirsutum]|nr:MAG: hypothetical protein M1813_006806 [Trichoglossum hirsutum]
MAVTIHNRNRHTSNTSSSRSAASIATRISAKVNSKVRSLVSKFEFLGRNNHGAGNIQNQPQHPRSKQRRSTIASIRQTAGHDRASTTKANLEMDEDEEEDFPMRPEVTHVFSNVDIGQPRKSVVKRCASMFDRLAKDRALAFEGRIHALASFTKQKSPQPPEELNFVTKGKGTMQGGVKALIRVFNRRPLSTDIKSTVDRPKPTRLQGSSAGLHEDIDLETSDGSGSDSSHSIVHDELCAISRFNSTSSPAGRMSTDQDGFFNKPQRRSTCLQEGSFEDFDNILVSCGGCPSAATLTDLNTPSPTIAQLSSVPLPLEPKRSQTNRPPAPVSIQSFPSTLFRVSDNHVSVPVGNRNSQDAVASCASCKPYQYEPCPSTRPSSQTSRSTPTSISSYELPISRAGGHSRGDSSTTSSESVITPQSEIELRRKGTPLPENYLAARRDDVGRFKRAIPGSHPGFSNGYWDLALRVVTEGDDDFYDESSDEEESNKEEDFDERTFHSGIREVLRKQSGRTNSQDIGLDRRVCISGATSSFEPLSQVISAPSFLGYGSEIYASEYYNSAGNGSNGYGNLSGNGDPEPVETCRDMPLGEIIHLLGRSVSLDQNTAPKRIRIPVYGMPPTKVLSPKPDMYHNTTKDIRHLIFRWS